LFVFNGDVVYSANHSVFPVAGLSERRKREQDGEGERGRDTETETDRQRERERERERARERERETERGGDVVILLQLKSTHESNACHWQDP
jgi:hypothetical protein